MFFFVLLLYFWQVKRTESSLNRLAAAGVSFSTLIPPLCSYLFRNGRPFLRLAVQPLSLHAERSGSNDRKEEGNRKIGNTREARGSLYLTRSKIKDGTQKSLCSLEVPRKKNRKTLQTRSVNEHAAFSVTCPYDAWLNVSLIFSISCLFSTRLKPIPIMSLTSGENKHFYCI